MNSTKDIVTDLARKAQSPAPDAIERVLIAGDLSKLSDEQRLSYYHRVCESMGLNPLTQPFQYLTLNGKLVLYATRAASEQLRKIHGVSITSLEKTFHEGLYVVTANATDKTGRADASTGAVSIGGLKGDALANAIMKCETKAKRRVTLSICGLGMLDETEVETIPGASTRPPLVVSAPQPEPVKLLDVAFETADGKTTPAKPEPLRVLKTHDYKTNGSFQYCRATLSDGREVQVRGAQMIAMLEQAAQLNWIIDVDTKWVTPRDKTQPGYELIESVERLDKPQSAPEAPPVEDSDMVL